MTLYREYYVTVQAPRIMAVAAIHRLGREPTRSRLIPFNDPGTGSPLCGTGATLLACKPRSVRARINLLDRDFCPRGATNSPPGTYTGSVSITPIRVGATIPVGHYVWNFELPGAAFRAFPMVRFFRPLMGSADADLSALGAP